MNAKFDKDQNQEILIAETTSEELSDEVLENVTGGSLALNFTKITYSTYDFGGIELHDQLTSKTFKIDVPNVLT